MCKKKNYAKYEKLYIFEKPLPRRINIYKNINKQKRSFTKTVFF